MRIILSLATIAAVGVAFFTSARPASALECVTNPDTGVRVCGERDRFAGQMATTTQSVHPIVNADGDVVGYVGIARDR
jgi:hypothetical protein